MNKSYFFPVLLIATGIILLLVEFSMIDLSRPYIFALVFIVISGLLFRKAYYSPEKKGVLGGTFFLLMTITIVLMDKGILDTANMVGFPMIFINLGIANVVYFIFSRINFSNLTFGIIFILASAPFLLHHYNYIPYWKLFDTLETYWPVLLITMGIGFLLEGFVKKAK